MRNGDTLPHRLQFVKLLMLWTSQFGLSHHKLSEAAEQHRDWISVTHIVLVPVGILFAPGHILSSPVHNAAIRPVLPPALPHGSKNPRYSSRLCIVCETAVYRSSRNCTKGDFLLWLLPFVVFALCFSDFYSVPLLYLLIKGSYINQTYRRSSSVFKFTRSIG